MMLSKNKSVRGIVTSRASRNAGIKHVKVIVAVSLILLSLVLIWFIAPNQNTNDSNISSSEPAGDYDVQSIDLGGISGGDASLLTSQSLSVNGQLRANNSLVLTPGNRPDNVTTGQVYYDAQTNTPYIYDGEAFQPLVLGQPVQSIGGANGNITVGSGILLSNNQLSLDNSVLSVINQAASAGSRVSSLQGQTGDVTLTSGNGISVNGTTIANTGVVSITAASPQLTVSQGPAGAYSIGVASGLATATGTVGTIAVFDSSNNLVDSLLTQTGTVLSAAGDVQVTGQIRTDSITGLTNGDELVIAAAPSGNLVFEVGGRSFTFPATGPTSQTICTLDITCAPGGGAASVTLQPSTVQEDIGSGASIFINNTGGGELLHLQGNTVDAFVVENNGDTAIAGSTSVGGDLTVAGAINASTINGGVITGGTVSGGSISGGTLTGTSVNGLGVSGTAITATGAFNINAGSGQNININTSGGGTINLGTSLMQGAGAITIAAGGSNQNLTLEGSGTGSVIIDVPVFHNANGATYTFNAADSGATNAVICTSIGNCIGSGAAVGGGGTGGVIAVWSGTGSSFTLTDSLLSQAAGAVTVSGDLIATNLQGNGSSVTNVNAAQLNGQAASYYTNASNIGSGTLNSDRLAADVAQMDQAANFTVSLAVNGNAVCTTAGNCAGTGAGVGGSGTPGTIAVWDGAGFSLTDSLIEQDTSGPNGLITLDGDVVADSFSGSGAGLTNVNAVTLNGQLPAYYLNAGNMNAGTLDDARLSANVAKYSDAIAAFLGSGSFVGTVSGADATSGNEFVTLDQLDAAVGGGGGGVTSLNGLDGDMILQGTTGQITVGDNGTDTFTLALDSAVTLQGNVVNAANGLVKLDASGLLPAVNGSLLTNVNAATLQGQAGSYYLDLGNATGTLNVARIADASLTNAKLQNSSLTVTAGNGLTTGGSVSLGGTTTLNIGAGDGISVTADAIAVDTTVCRTTGNCAGSGAGVGGSAGAGVGTLALWDGTYTIKDSSVSVDGSGNVTVAGDVAADNFSGNGSALTNLNASNLTTGTVSDGRLSSNVTLQGNTVNAANGLVRLNASGQLPALDASLLTSLNASALTSGTVADGRLSANVALLNASANFTGATLQLNGSDVCTTAGNCTGSGGGGVGSGTNGVIAVWTGTGTTLADSILSQDGGNLVLSDTSNGTITTAGTNQTLTLQGNGTGGVNIIVPTFENENGATYTFGTDASGNYEVCTTAGNCLGGGGGISGSGTAGTVALWTGSGFTVGDSAVTQTGSGATSTVTAANDVTVTGDLVAATLQGNGSAITNVNAAQLNGQAASYYTNASNISSGTLADARLSGNVTLMGNTFNGANQLVQLDATGKLPVLDGSALTSVNAAQLNGQSAAYYLNASNIASGTLSDSRLSANVALLNAPTQTFAGDVAVTGALTQGGNAVCTTAGNCAGTGAGVGGSGTPGTIAVWDGTGFTLSDSSITQDVSGNVTVAGDLAATNLQGNGSAITDINASAINSGTLADARLSTNVTLAGNTFNTANNLVRLNASGQLPALDGSLLTNLNATSIATGTLADARLSANVALLNASANFTGASLQYNGQNVCTTAGNCVGTGVGSAIGGGGTQYSLAMFTPDGFNIGDSIAAQNAAGTVMTISGQLSATSLSASAGASITGNSTIVGTLTGLTGVTSNGTITFSGLNTAGIVHNSASGVLSTSLITNADLQGGTYGAITGVGALNAGSIASGFGTINTTNAITTTVTVTGGTVNATTGGYQTDGTTRLGDDGSLQNITGYAQTGGNFVQGGGGTFDTGTGAVSLNGATTANSTLNVVGATTLQNNLTVNGAQFTNNGSTLNTALVLGDFPAGGSIGTAGATVDNHTAISIPQTTAGQILDIPSPTSTVAGRVLYLFNTGTQAFTIEGASIAAGYSQTFVWNGTAWVQAANGGGTVITLQGAYDGGNVINTTDAKNIQFTLNDTATDANFITNIASGSSGQFKVQNNGTDVLSIGSTGQLSLAVQGAAGGLAIGGDTQIYRSATNRLMMTNALTVRPAVDSTTAFQIQNAAGTDLVTVNTTNGVLTAVGGLQSASLDTASAGTLTVGGANATGITMADNVTVAAGQSLTLTGGTTASRPASPTEGMMYFDTDTDKLLVYSNGKWQADRTGVTKTVAPNNASQAVKDSADYVADGTGDQTEINAALTAAAGGKVYLFEGTYVVNASISVPNNTTLAGAGRGTLIELADLDAAATVIANTDQTTGVGVTIQDLRVDGRKDLNTAGEQHGIYLQGMGASTGTNNEGARITNVYANNFNGYGIRLATVTHASVTNSQASGNTLVGIQGCIVSYFTISGNTITDNTVGVTLCLSNQINVTGNQVSENGTGISSNSSDAVMISNNTVYANSTRGIYLLNGAVRNTVSNNRIRDNGGSTTTQGIVIIDSDFNTIQNNTISDSTATTNSYAIDIQNSASDGNYLSDNIIGSTSTIVDSGTGTISAGQIDTSGNYKIQPAGGADINLNGDVNVTGTLTVTGAGNVAYQHGTDYSTVGTTNNVNLGTGALFRLTGASAQTITGIAGGTDGRIITIINAGANDATLSDSASPAAANSSAANRIVTGTGSDLTIAAGASVSLVYDSVSTVWRVVGTISGGTSGGSYVSLQGSTPGTADVGNLNITGAGVFGGAVTVTNTGSAALLVQNASSSVLLTADTSAMQVVIGNGGNTITLSANGITLAGTARNAKTILLSPEYENTVLNAGTGSNNTGTMTSGYDIASRMNYYNWTTSQGTSQSYDIVTQVPLPKDFAAWDSTTPVSVTGWTSNTTNGTILMEVRDSAGTVKCNFVAVTPGSASTWSTNTTACTYALLTASSPTYTAGDYITIRIRLQAPTGGNNTRVGNIKLNYLSNK